MTAPAARRGGAPVGRVADLGDVEAMAVLYLRLWCDGPEAQAEVWNDFAAALGPAPGRAALKAFEQLCELCVRYGRRPLTRRQVACECVGADESCFANFIAAAAEGQREDAMLIATLIVRADVAPGLAGLAETVGLALSRIALRAGAPAPQPTNTTLH